MRLTQSIAHARAHLAAWWPQRSRARELKRQYAAAKEIAPLALADLMRVTLMYDDVHAAGDDTLTKINIGKRQVGLHLKAMLDLTPDDLDHLEEETKNV